MSIGHIFIFKLFIHLFIYNVHRSVVLVGEFWMIMTWINKSLIIKNTHTNMKLHSLFLLLDTSKWYKQDGVQEIQLNI